MIDRRKLLTHIHDQEEKVLLARVLDLCDIVLKNHRPQATDFYDPQRTSRINSLVDSINGLKAVALGGYEQAERKRTMILPDNYVGEDLSRIICLLIDGNFKMNKVTHRDYLGALLGLGIKREKLGDIVVLENGAQVMVAEEIAQYIISNLEKIGRVRVTVRELADQVLILPEQNFKEIRATVPSLRLDVICGASFGISRSKIAREITADWISLNWHACSDLSQPVKEKDIISGRGRGRVEIYEVAGQTKKGRISVVLRKYL